MISTEMLKKLGNQYQMAVYPNVVREYFQHIFLSELYKLPKAEKLFFKGGTAFRIVYGSPRFSEDLDFSLLDMPQNEIKSFVEELFIQVLAEMAQMGLQVELGEKSGVTSGGYFGIANFKMPEYQPVSVEINISTRKGKKIAGEADSIANDFTPPYTIIHLPQVEMVEEKIFGALLTRKKPRDFYDLYMIMRKGMLTAEQKKRLVEVRDIIISFARQISFKSELEEFLPANQQGIIKDFSATLERELNNQLGGA